VNHDYGGAGIERLEAIVDRLLAMGPARHQMGEVRQTPVLQLLPKRRHVTLSEWDAGSSDLFAGRKLA
jgi:hypothetical protein